MNTTTDYQFDVSADGIKKEDSVISYLRESMEEKPDKEIIKFLFWGNPNSSGLVTQSTNPVTLAARDSAVADLTRRVYATYSQTTDRGFVSNRDFDYAGLEKPTNKVTIPTRVGHAIRSYLNILDLAYLISAKMHVETALGNEWPKREHKDGKVVKVEGESSINRTTVRSLISRCQNELADTLPGIIDGMYQHKYRSVGAFTYSLAEIRCFQVEPRYIEAAAQWIIEKTGVRSGDGSTFGEIAAGTQYGTGYSLVAQTVDRPRMLKAYEEWSKITYAARTRTPRYPPALDKFARTFATRLGKNLYTKEDAQYKPASLALVTELINLFELVIVPREGDEITNLQLLKTQTKQKNDFQENMKNCILDYFEYQFVEANGAYNLNTVIDFMNRVLYAHVSNFNQTPKFQAINMDLHLVYVDRLMNATTEMSKDEVHSVLATLRGSNGIVNERTMNAILRCFAVESDYERRVKVSRKALPAAVDEIVASLPHLDKIKLSAEDPALVLTHTEHIQNPELRRAYESYKATNPNGWLQKGVMSMLSALKTSEEYDEAKLIKSKSANLANLAAYFNQARDIGNALDEISSLFEQYYNPYFTTIAKQTADAEKARKAAERQDKDREKWLKSQNELRASLAAHGQVAAAPVQHVAHQAVPQAAAPVHHNMLPVHTQHVPVVEQVAAPVPVKVEEPYVPAYGATASPPVAAGQFAQFDQSSIPSAIPSPTEFSTGSPAKMPGFDGLYAHASPSAAPAASNFMMPSLPAFIPQGEVASAELKAAASHSPKSGHSVHSASQLVPQVVQGVASPSGSAGSSSFNLGGGFPVAGFPVAAQGGASPSGSGSGVNLFPGLPNFNGTA